MRDGVIWLRKYFSYNCNLVGLRGGGLSSLRSVCWRCSTSAACSLSVTIFSWSYDPDVFQRMEPLLFDIYYCPSFSRQTWSLMIMELLLSNMCGGSFVYCSEKLDTSSTAPNYDSLQHCEYKREKVFSLWYGPSPSNNLSLKTFQRPSLLNATGALPACSKSIGNLTVLNSLYSLKTNFPWLYDFFTW